MKYEWKKQEKSLYLPKEKPELITVPQQKFLMIKGEGNPNHEDYAQRVEALYSLAYAIRMMPKQGHTPEGYFEYTVYPLEGIWDLSEKGRKLEVLDKDELVYTIMIRQPEFVTEEVMARALAAVKKKKPHALLDDIVFDTMEDGLSLQILHVGPYDDEPRSFALMKEYINQNNLERTSLLHREIYISDVRKVDPAKLKTVLRYWVKPKE